jgi:cell division septation protein DedD
MMRSTPPTPMTRHLLAAVLAFVVAGCSGDADFDNAARSNTTVAWDDYLRAHPDSAHAHEARERLAALVEAGEWERAHAADTADAYKRYLRGYPQGAHANDALDAITHLNLAAAPSTEAPVEPPPAGSNPAAGAITRGPAPPPAATTLPPKAAPVHAAPKPATTKAPVAGATPAAARPATPGGFRVQLGAFADGSASADRAWHALSARYPDLASRTPLIAAARAANGRSIYRLQLGGFDRASAEALCERLAAHHDACVLVAPAPTR